MDNPQRDLAYAILDSEAFMWLMVGANHPEAWLNAIRPIWLEYCNQGGGYKNASNRRTEMAKRIQEYQTAWSKGEHIE